MVQRRGAVECSAMTPTMQVCVHFEGRTREVEVVRASTEERMGWMRKRWTTAYGEEELFLTSRGLVVQEIGREMDLVAPEGTFDRNIRLERAQEDVRKTKKKWSEGPDRVEPVRDWLNEPATWRRSAKHEKSDVVPGGFGELPKHHGDQEALNVVMEHPL